MSRNRRRHSTGFGYIGFGNNQGLFNQHSKKAFSSLKETLEQNSQTHFQLNFTHKDLTKAEKEIIKNKIRKAEKLQIRKTIVLLILILILVIFSIKLLIDNFMSNI
ncbi:hypothetical protein QLS71_018585 [Mariniflexile litorale]|uniref:Uncharacterized protein n=1 Tax=Mariniflexile litorale TaxID=3045158 RepID=A0AAU7EDZ7_9FLAO|nr:hypothetical protein [Mariniflexile sp. KMM 9835]MDQ8211790.1 hypothetical protein [Mariniflexile sp. KMM 9835]